MLKIRLISSPGHPTNIHHLLVDRRGMVSSCRQRPQPGRWGRWRGQVLREKMKRP